MAERTVVLIAASKDDEESEYWSNFVHRVKHALDRERLQCRVIVGTSAEMRPPQVR